MTDHASLPTLSQPQQALLAEIVAAGDTGMVVPGARGSTAKVLRAHGLVEVVPGDHKPPPRQRATATGREWKALDDIRAIDRAALIFGGAR